MRFVSFDMATTTGWAVQGLSGTYKVPNKPGESPGMRFLRFRAWVKAVIQAAPGTGPIVVVYEEAHHRGGPATRFLVGLATVLKEVVAEQEIAGEKIEIMSVPSKTLKLWATGKGNSSKEMMVEEARRRGFDPKDDNEADAILLRLYAITELDWDNKEVN